MQAKDLNGFNPDFLKEPLEAFSTIGPNSKWDSRNGIYNRKRLEIGLSDIQRQPFECTSDEDVASSIPSEVNESPSKRTKVKSRRAALALNELINKEKIHSKSVNNYKSKIDHVLHLIKSHSKQCVSQDVHGQIRLPMFALALLILIFLISFLLKSLGQIIQWINVKLLNFICCKKHLPLTCLALILYIFLMIFNAILSFLMNPVPRKIFEWLAKA
ncbi:hypothetical protein HA402_001146 [Bradysia odoriphaga]|nr:hypothetical protein HA402_001146 [Bradysia odoriphaga]